MVTTPESVSPVRERGATTPGSRTLRTIRLPRWFDPLGVVGVIAIYGVWYLVTNLHWVAPLFLPAPQAVGTFIQRNFFVSPLIKAQNLGGGGIFESLLFTVGGVWLGIAASVAIGLPIGLLSARFGLLRMFSDPLLLTIGGIPIPIVAPFFMVWFGVDRAAQLLLLTMFCVPVIYIYAQRAVDNLSSVYESSARVFGASRGRVIRDVYVRGTLPEVLGAMRIALAGSWGLAAIVELMGAPRGIGKLIASFSANTNVIGIFSVVLCLAVVACLTDLVVVLAMRFINRWA
jgi:ABC-type nitrate/sulfonate/bicarbonate transport system permease component